ncbi:hypothetical protein LCGC14_2302510 [marine sediment metagenome]|uniref:HTH marR-type domain-containing protein n=1 Tax=marine sediment metagenome TaxID=412755 RepID=A0A0F9DAI0_9ZZZZ
MSITRKGKTVDKEYQKAIRLLEEFRKIDPIMPIQTAVVFLTVASEEGINMSDLAERADITQASCSRNVGSLASYNRHKKAGHGLLTSREDALERRRKLVFLTDEGRIFAQNVLKLI